MKNRFLGLLILGAAFFSACNDDDDNPGVPPTINDVVGTYSGDKLIATVNGTTAGENAMAQVRQNADSTTTLILNHIVPDCASIEIPNMTYSALSRSNYYSQLSGQVADNMNGINVQANASIEEDVMNLTVTTSEIPGTPADAKGFYELSYTGEMTIELGDISSPIEQTVYITPPSNGEATNIGLRIENFSFDNLELGTIELDNVPFVQRGDVYAFSASDQELVLDGLAEIGISSVSLDVKGAFIDKSHLQLTLTVDATILTVNVKFEGMVSNAFRDSYTMTEWTTPAEANFQEPLYLATSNAAADMFKLASGMLPDLTVEPYFVTQDGDAAKIITRDTYGASIFGIVIPKVTSGTLFNGTFKINATETLKSTKFGQAFLKETAPRTFTFTYKYTPGATYYKTIITGSELQTTVSVEEVPDKTDQCSIAAYLYEVEDYTESLDGTNINTSEKVIMKAVFNSDQQDSFTTKTINFEETGNGTFDPSKLYKMAVVFTPSKDGDQYAGAPESTLWIQSFEVAY